MQLLQQVGEAYIPYVHCSLHVGLDLQRLYNWQFVNQAYRPRVLVVLELDSFLANVNSSSCSLYVIVRPSVVCRL